MSGAFCILHGSHHHTEPLKPIHIVISSSVAGNHPGHHCSNLAQRFDAGEDPEQLLRARAAEVDALIREVWAQCIPAEADLALFAVGGYGRGELYPHSDIDLMVLAGEGAHTENLGRLFARLWDMGLPASHSVRTLDECARAARDDITVMTALMEARPLVVSDQCVNALVNVMAAPDLWPAHDYFLAKREELRQRHARYGDTADNLEPNLKDGPGGLRDLQTIQWMAMRIFGVRDLHALMGIGQLGMDECVTFEREHRVLSRLRFGLHLVAGKAEERLRFDYQKALAALLLNPSPASRDSGHADLIAGEGLGKGEQAKSKASAPAAQARPLPPSAPSPASGRGEQQSTALVESMMQTFYRSAAMVRRMTARLFQRFEEHLEGTAPVHPVNAEFAIKRTYLMARDEFWPGGDLARVFDLFACWSERPQVERLDSHTARALAESLHTLPSYTEASPALREAFMQLLRGPSPVQTLERMARTGVLGRWIPAFAKVSGRMQFDLFHVYTVDQHTLMVLRNLDRFARNEPDPQFQAAHEVYPLLPRPELLLLAGLFHDIAKGRGGDHSELGAEDARAFCRAHGLPDADTALVEWLVRHHLIMSSTAQKQDISDPAVIHRFASEVGDRERLDYLYLLTCADIAGTSPSLWNAWKDRLLSDLRTVTRLALRRGLENPLAASERIAGTRARVAELLAEDNNAFDTGAIFARMPAEAFLRARADLVAWQARALHGSAPGATTVRLRRLAGATDALDVFVHAPDRDGLFAAIVMTLDRLGFDILQARALDGPDATIFDTFQVLPRERREPPNLTAIEHALTAMLHGELDAIHPARRAQPLHLKHFRIKPELRFEASADGARTVMSLVCTDRPGLLADIAHTLRDHAIRVHDARIATFGARAEDIFRISDNHNQPLDDATCQRLHRALLSIIDLRTQP